VTAGARSYESYCVQCHGTGAYSGGVVTDLRFSNILADAAAWHSVVAEGSMEALGMIGFSAELSDEAVENIRHFVIDRNRYARSTGAVTLTGK